MYRHQKWGDVSTVYIMHCLHRPKSTQRKDICNVHPDVHPSEKVVPQLAQLCSSNIKNSQVIL